jgi:vacuolar protein sorting-associated protein 13A/C
VGTGVKDFFYKPFEGFVDGPLEGGRGVLQGTGSLLKHSTEGIFGSVAKIVGSASKGILILSDDQDYIKARETNNVSERP